MEQRFAEWLARSDVQKMLNNLPPGLRDFAVTNLKTGFFGGMACGAAMIAVAAFERPDQRKETMQ